MKREEILPHEPGGDGLAAGHRLDLGFIEVAVEVGLDGGDHASTGKAGKIGRDVVVVLLGKQRFDRRVAAVVTEHVADQVDEGGFAVVAALAIYEKEDLLDRDAGQRVADSLLDEDPQGSVIARDAPQEVLEQRTLGTAVGADRRDLCQQIAGVVLLAPAGPQVDGALYFARGVASEDSVVRRDALGPFGH